MGAYMDAFMQQFRNYVHGGSDYLRAGSRDRCAQVITAAVNRPTQRMLLCGTCHGTCHQDTYIMILQGTFVLQNKR